MHEEVASVKDTSDGKLDSSLIGEWFEWIDGFVLVIYESALIGSPDGKALDMMLRALDGLSLAISEGF